MGFFVGQLMAVSKARADPTVTAEVVQRLLDDSTENPAP
jgi:Asp-tRNA(Asn)/Glu-tRNA(Gln) amidotransferase B subunit